MPSFRQLAHKARDTIRVEKVKVKRAINGAKTHAERKESRDAVASASTLVTHAAEARANLDSLTMRFDELKETQPDVPTALNFYLTDLASRLAALEPEFQTCDRLLTQVTTLEAQVKQKAQEVSDFSKSKPGMCEACIEEMQDRLGDMQSAFKDAQQLILNLEIELLSAGRVQRQLRQDVGLFAALQQENTQLQADLSEKEQQIAEKDNAIAKLLEQLAVSEQPRYAQEQEAKAAATREEAPDLHPGLPSAADTAPSAIPAALAPPPLVRQDGHYKAKHYARLLGANSAPDPLFFRASEAGLDNALVPGEPITAEVKHEESIGNPFDRDIFEWDEIDNFEAPQEVAGQEAAAGEEAEQAATGGVNNGRKRLRG